MGWRTFVLIYWCTQASVGKTEREHPLNQSVAETCGKFGRLCCTTSLPTFKADLKALVWILKKNRKKITQRVYYSRCKTRCNNFTIEIKHPTIPEHH